MLYSLKNPWSCRWFRDHRSCLFNFQRRERGHCLTVHRPDDLCLKLWGSTFVQTLEAGPRWLSRTDGKDGYPSGLEGRVQSQRDYLARFWNHLTLFSSSLFPIPPVWREECLSCACPTNAFYYYYFLMIHVFKYLFGRSRSQLLMRILSIGVCWSSWLVRDRIQTPCIGSVES